MIITKDNSIKYTQGDTFKFIVNPLPNDDLSTTQRLRFQVTDSPKHTPIISMAVELVDNKFTIVLSDEDVAKLIVGDYYYRCTILDEDVVLTEFGGDLIVSWQAVGNAPASVDIPGIIDLSEYLKKTEFNDRIANYSTTEDMNDAISDATSSKQDLLTFTDNYTTANPVATKNYVNDSVEQVASYYITKDADGNPFATYAELENAEVYYSGGVVRELTRNDYCVVLADESKATETESPTTRYSWNNGWQFQYVVNNTGFNATQMSAINSGITSNWMTQTTTNINAKANANTVYTKDEIDILETRVKGYTDTAVSSKADISTVNGIGAYASNLDTIKLNKPSGVDSISIVTKLPTSPQSNVLYFVKEV